MPTEIRCRVAQCQHNKDLLCGAGTIFVVDEKRDQSILAVCRTFDLASREPWLSRFAAKVVNITTSLFRRKVR